MLKFLNHLRIRSFGLLSLFIAGSVGSLSTQSDYIWLLLLFIGHSALLYTDGENITNKSLNLLIQKQGIESRKKQDLIIELLETINKQLKK